jgi:hypothetical protein
MQRSQIILLICQDRQQTSLRVMKVHHGKRVVVWKVVNWVAAILVSMSQALRIR